MERERERISIPPVGATTLLTVFAVLCLTMFALLALSDVRSDARLADASLESMRAYYAADAMAQEVLAKLRNGEDVDGIEEVRFTDTTPDGTWQHDTVYRYTVPISDAQELQVSVAVDGGDYRILRWQAVSTVAWDEEFGLDVWIPD